MIEFKAETEQTTPALREEGSRVLDSAAGHALAILPSSFLVSPKSSNDDSLRPGEQPLGSAFDRAGMGQEPTLRESADGAAPAPMISVVIPLWNEEANVKPLTTRVFQALQDEARAVELIVVDDASTDGTWDLLVQEQVTEPRLRVVRLVTHRGQSAALWAGFSASRGGIIATLDGDLQNDPADLPRLLKELQNHDLVCGLRAKRQDNALRRVSSWVARWARKLVLGVDFRDTGCNLRVFKRSVLETLFPFDGLHRFMPVLAHASGHDVLEMPVAHHPRTAGKSKYGVWNRLGRGLWDLAAMAWYRKRQLSRIGAVEHIPKQRESTRPEL